MQDAVIHTIYVVQNSLPMNAKPYINTESERQHISKKAM